MIMSGINPVSNVSISLTFFALSFSARPLKCISTGISKPAYPSSFTTKGSLVSTEM